MKDAPRIQAIHTWLLRLICATTLHRPLHRVRRCQPQRLRGALVTLPSKSPLHMGGNHPSIRSRDSTMRCPSCINGRHLRPYYPPAYFASRFSTPTYGGVRERRTSQNGRTRTHKDAASICRQALFFFHRGSSWDLICVAKRGG